jgi:hypothetical protein
MDRQLPGLEHPDLGARRDITRPRINSVTLRSWKPVRRGSLRGYATFVTRAMVIHDCAVNITDGRPWVALPGKAMLDHEGRQIITDGKKRYLPVFEWRNRNISDEFTALAIEALREAGISVD